jgi:hypothetical protein
MNELQQRPGEYPPNLIFRAKTGELVVQHNGQEWTLPPDALLVPDYGRREVGHLQWKPFDDEQMHLAMHHELPPPDEPGSKYLSALRWPVLVKGYGRCRMTSTSKGLLSAAKRWLEAYLAGPEAGQDMLPVYRVHDPQAYEVDAIPEAGTLYRPVWRALAWMQRDPTVFGRRLVPLPAPALPLDGPTPAATDHLFDDLERTGDVLPPVQSAASAPRATARPTQRQGRQADRVYAGDLDDAVPF